MRNRLLVMVVSLTTLYTAGAMADDPIADPYLSRAYWERMQWEKATASKLWTMDGWSTFEGKQDTTNTFVKSRKFSMLANQFSANLAFQNGLSELRHFTSILAHSTKKQCDDYLKVFTRKFGAPLTNDASVMVMKFSEINYLRMLVMNYQWDIGQTRINAGCFGTITQDNEDADKPDYTWSMMFSHKSLAEKLTSKFALRCSRRLEYITGSQSPKELDDMVFWVNPYTKELTTVTHSPIGKEVEISEESIRFRIDTENAVSRYLVNRVSGGFDAEIHVQGKLGGRISGKCEKTSAPQAKF